MRTRRATPANRLDVGFLRSAWARRLFIHIDALRGLQDKQKMNASARSAEEAGQGRSVRSRARDAVVGSAKNISKGWDDELLRPVGLRECPALTHDDGVRQTSFAMPPFVGAARRDGRAA